MADVIGSASSYDLTVGEKISIDEAIYMLSPMDSPLLTGVDSDGLSVLGKLPVTEVEHTWQHEEILTPRSRLGGAATTGDTIITVASGDRAKFSTGDVFIVAKANASEHIRITGYGTTADTLLVSRALAGTATNYTSGATIIGLGTALPEGSNPENPRYRDRTTAYNVTQIFGPYEIDMSGTQRVLGRYGVPDQFSHEVWKRTQEIGIAREQALIYGARYNSADTKIRTHGGIDYYNNVNVDTTSTQLTVTSIQALQVLQFDYGGIADRLTSNPKSLGDLNATSDTNRVRQEFADSRRGRVPVTVVTTEFGDVTIVRNRWVAPIHAFMFNREQAVVRTLRPMVLEKLAKTGDSDQVMLVGEFSFTFKAPQHAGKFTNLTY